MKILAVDDDAFILELIPMIAAKVGFPDVTAVDSGELALETLMNSQQGFDCLLLDIHMPGMDGIDLCRHVRAIPAYRTTPIVMLTAVAEKGYIDRAFGAGATDYATKPFDVIEIGARLRVAQELTLARKGNVAEKNAEGALSSTSKKRHDFDLSDAVQIEGVKGLIDYPALGNYMTQLSRAGLYGSMVLAIKIDWIETIYAKASSDEFLYALHEVADAVGDVFATRCCLMAYAGRGFFVAIVNGEFSSSPTEIETTIQSLLDEKNSEYDDGTPMDLEVSIGNPLKPNTSNIQDVLKTFDRAIARADNRLNKKIQEPRPLGIRAVGL